MCCLVECFVCFLFIVYRFLDCEYTFFWREISLVRSFTKVPRVETLVSLGRNKSFVEEKQKFQAVGTKVSLRWN